MLFELHAEKITNRCSGSLVRSAGGWAAVKALRAAKIFEKGDERILGNGDFVETVLSAANETMEKKYDLQALSPSKKKTGKHGGCS